MSIGEILANVALFFGIVIFGGACFWTMYTLSKDDKKHSHKTKKA